MKKNLLLVVVSAIVAGCSKEHANVQSKPAEAVAAHQQASQVTLKQLYDIVVDLEMPDAEKFKLYNAFNKSYVEWDCFLGDAASDGHYMLYPVRNAVGGLKVIPPKGMATILKQLDRLTPLRVKGILVSDFNGLHLEASDIDLQKPNQSLEPTPMAVTPPAAQEPRQP